MPIDPKKLKELLIETELVDEKTFDSVLKIAVKEKKPVEDLLVEKDVVSDQNLGRLIADSLGFRFINLRQVEINEKTLKTIPELVAKKQVVVVFKRDKDGIHLAMKDPTNVEVIASIEKKTGEKVIPYYATKQDILGSLTLYTKGIKEEFGDVIASNIGLVRKATPEEVPVIKIVDTILRYAYENHASDIHIEPREEKVVLRYRVDGVMHEIIDLPKNIHELIVSRIKIMSKLRTDEHRAAQDGKLQFKFEGQKVDVRVSILPIVYGENVVMRLLSEKARRFSLEDLGMGEADLKKVRSVMRNPWGMFLSTGPTGCGKTTTLYAMLKILNVPQVNIATIEDPVEYDIEGVNQIQVNPKTNLTFAKGLRSILRQDPDIIMVGEIRDEETAGIAVNAALTGHLVLSTLHTNDAATTLPRLIDMKVEPFLITSTVNASIGQRLIRRICTSCIQSHAITSKELDLVESQMGKDAIEKYKLNKKGTMFYKGAGCPVCNHTGYKGRTGIFEVLVMDDTLREMIMKNANADQIRILAIKNGMTTMLDDGMNKVLNGLTTIDEILRVTKQ